MGKMQISFQAKIDCVHTVVTNTPGNVKTRPFRHSNERMYTNYRSKHNFKSIQRLWAGRYGVRFMARGFPSSKPADRL